MTEEFRRGRADRRKQLKQKPTFSHIRQDGEAMFKTHDGAKYTQAELKQFFGLVIPVPKNWRKKVNAAKKIRAKASGLMKQIMDNVKGL